MDREFRGILDLMLPIIQERTRNNELEMLNVNVNIVLCCAIEGCPFMMSWNEMDNVGFVRIIENRHFLDAILYKNDHFTKTGSEQT